MTFETLLSLFAFSFVSSITPGPNNLMLMTSGTNFGFRRTLPHMFGVALGFSLMILIVGLGVVGIFEKWPVTYQILKVLCVVYMLWLAWKIANAAAPAGRTVEESKPFGFLQAMAFQWVNPKAWSMVLSAVTLYSPHSEVKNLLIMSGVSFLVNIPSVTSWTLLGQKLRDWLSQPKQLRIFNWSMAALLIASMAMML